MTKLKRVVFVQLLDEGVDVWARVEAEEDAGGVFRLPASAPDGQTWSFARGSQVVCERRGASLFAVRVAETPD